MSLYVLEFRVLILEDVEGEMSCGIVVRRLGETGVVVVVVDVRLEAIGAAGIAAAGWMFYRKRQGVL